MRTNDKKPNQNWLKLDEDEFPNYQYYPSNNDYRIENSNKKDSYPNGSSSKLNFNNKDTSWKNNAMELNEEENE